MEKPCIGGNKVPRLQFDDVAWNQHCGIDDLFLSVPDHPHMGSRQIFQCIERLFCLTFLHDTHNGIHDNDQKNQNRLKKLFRVSFHTCNHKRDSGSGKQNQYHSVFELVGKALQHSLLFLFFQLVFSERFLFLHDLRIGKSAVDVRRKFLYNSFT